MKKLFIFLGLSVAATFTASAQIADSAQRHVVLQGAANFRDLGGYKTADGRQVKWGKVYRSADISKLTTTDLAELEKRHVKYDVDLRGHQESAQAPDKLNPGTDYVLCPAGSDSLSTMTRDFAAHKPADSIMLAFYNNTRYLADRYKPFFQKLMAAPADDALVFHCTAGKDRTGIAAALFLYSLGVPYNTIVSDYTATNYYRQNENAKTVAAISAMMNIDKESAKKMMGAKPEYIAATFDAIKKQYGSVDNFLKNQIGLSNKDLKQLRDKYLQ